MCPRALFDLKVDHISDNHDRGPFGEVRGGGLAHAQQRHDAHVAAFLCYLKGLSPKTGWEGRVGIPFGSYGWGTNGPDEVAAVLEACGFDLPLGTLSHQWVEDEEHLAQLQAAVAGVVGR